MAKSSISAKIFLVYPESMIGIRIQAYALIVELESTESHPDALTDLTNRATAAFATVVESMKLTGIPVYNPDFDDEEDTL